MRFLSKCTALLLTRNHRAIENKWQSREATLTSKWSVYILSAGQSVFVSMLLNSLRSFRSFGRRHTIAWVASYGTKIVKLRQLVVVGGATTSFLSLLSSTAHRVTHPRLPMFPVKTRSRFFMHEVVQETIASLRLPTSSYFVTSRLLLPTFSCLKSNVTHTLYRKKSIKPGLHSHLCGIYSFNWSWISRRLNRSKS